jgi:hypothetical protein
MMVEILKHGDDGYDDVYNHWVADGRAATTERLGLFGGQCWYALNRKNETYPTFLLCWSDGPTELDTSDDMDETGRITKKGYSETRGKDGGVNIKYHPGSGWRIKTRPVHKEDD